MSQVQVDKIDYRGKYLMKYLQRSFRNPALPKFVHLCPFLKPLNAFFPQSEIRSQSYAICFSFAEVFGSV